MGSIPQRGQGWGSLGERGGTVEVVPFVKTASWPSLSLERHQIFVPTSGEDDPTEVARLARISLGLEFEQISQP